MARTKNNAPELMVAFDAGEPVKPEKEAGR